MKKMKNTNWKKFLTTAALCTSMAVGTMGFSLTALGATINTDGVNIRGEATTDSGIIGSLYQGDVVNILETVTAEDGTTWYRVQLSNGNTGYVRSDFVDDDGTAADQTSSETEAAPEENEPETTVADGSAQETADTEAVENTENVAVDATVQPAEVTEPSSLKPNEDPNTNYNLEYVTNADGTGAWYVLNADTGERVAIGDMDAAQAQNGAGVSKGWRTAAILFGILLIAAIGFILFLLKSIFEGRKKPRRRAAVVKEKKDEEFFDFDDAQDEAQDGDDEEEFEEVQDEDVTDVEVDTEDVDEPAQEDTEESEETEEEYDFDDEEEFEEIKDEDVDAEDDSEDDEEYFDDLDEDDAPARGRKEGGFFGFMKKLLRSDEDEDEDEDGEIFDDEEFVEVDADPKDEEFEEYEEEDSYEFGEDFDEEAEYPEDVDLLPKKTPVVEPVEEPEEVVEKTDEAESVAQDEQIKLSMDKVMRNIKAEAEEEFILDKDLDFDEESDEDPDEELFDDDDDMEYSFLSTKRK